MAVHGSARSSAASSWRMRRACSLVESTCRSSATASGGRGRHRRASSTISTKVTAVVSARQLEPLAELLAARAHLHQLAALLLHDVRRRLGEEALVGEP